MEGTVDLVTELLAERLDPQHLDTSPRMHSLLGYIMGRTWTDPELYEVTATSDGFLFAVTRTADGELQCDVFLGSVGAVGENLRELATLLGGPLGRAFLRRARGRIPGL